MTSMATANTSSATNDKTVRIVGETPTSSSIVNNNNNEGNNSNEDYNTNTNTKNQTPDEIQLSNDLVSFLSNPSLSANLMDGSLDLANYALTVEQELQDLESLCISVYRTKSDDVQFVHTELNECNNILYSLHEMLLGFQADLGGLSTEIRTLQEKSRLLDTQLHNRKHVEHYLRKFLQKIVIPPNIANIILNGNVANSNFVSAVQEVQQIYKSCHTTSLTSETNHGDSAINSNATGTVDVGNNNSSSSSSSTNVIMNNTSSSWSCGIIPTETIAVKEMQIIVDQLRLVAMKRIREYFIQQLYLLRRPQTNIRMIQVHGLLKYNILHDIYEDFAPTEICKREIYNIYIESMNKTLVQLFRTYQIQLLQVDITKISATRIDVIAIEDSYLRDTITTKAKSNKKYDVFCLGNRMKDCFGIDTTTTSSSTNIPTTKTSGTFATTATTSPSSSSNTSTTTATTTTATTSGNQPRRISIQSRQLPKKLPPNNTIENNNEGSNNNDKPASNSGIGSTTADIMNNDDNDNYDYLLYSLQQQSPILAHVAINENKKYPYECLFRSLLGHLIDSVTNEHIFCRQFFKRDAYNALFNNTLSIILEQLENYLFNCYDAICLLLMIKVTHCYRRIVKIRKIHNIDSFLDQITHLLWPRLKTVMDNHMRSINSANATTLGTIDLHAHYISRRMGEFCCSILLILHTNTTSTSTTPTNINTMMNYPTSSSGTSQPSMMIHRNNDKQQQRIVGGTEIGEADNHSRSTLGDDDTTTKATSRNNVAVINTVTNNTSQSAGDKLLDDLTEMINSFVHLLERLSETHNTQKKRTVFFINNLDHIVCIFQERRVVGKELNRFVELLMQQREIFVEEELLTTGFSKMIAFVQQTEAHITAQMNNEANRNTSGGGSSSNNNNNNNAGNRSTHSGGNISFDVNPSVVESLVLDFATSWKSNIEQINRNVLSYFSNFRNGMEILKQCLTQLLLYYTRFQDIIRKVFRTNNTNSALVNSITKDLVSTNAILAEIKRYALAI